MESDRKMGLRGYINTDIIARLLKPVEWVGSSRNDVRSFPKAARDGIGHQLFFVQIGRKPSDWKPMPSVGKGVCEIRVHGRLEHRLIYAARFEEAVYVLHAFEKKSRKTAGRDIEIARRRYAEVVRRRQAR